MSMAAENVTRWAGENVTRQEVMSLRIPCGRSLFGLSLAGIGAVARAYPAAPPSQVPNDKLDPLAGLTVAPEHRCSPYLRSDYPYPQSVEEEIVDRLGEIWSPYTGERFESLRASEIEHVVALAEAHDSGACRWTAERRHAFSRDLNNLTLADPTTNRDKGSKDVADWLPPRSRCWFADRVLSVKLAWSLSVDDLEAALRAVLANCSQAARANPDPPGGS